MKQPALGSAIASLRNQKGMTQKELADACTIDIRTIQRIEAGEVSPRMHTMRLLTAALGCDAGAFAGAPESDEKTGNTFISRLRLPFLAGIVHSINAIPVVVDLITHSFNSYFQASTLLVHMVSGVFFFRGFYLIGRQNNNPVLAVSSLLAMVLLPLVNIAWLLRAYYPGSIAGYPLFLLLCINQIILGIGLLAEAYKRKGQYSGSLYGITGVVMILLAGMYLSLTTPVVSTALVISLLCNAVTTMILYREYKSGGPKKERSTNGASSFQYM